MSFRPKVAGTGSEVIEPLVPGAAVLVGTAVIAAAVVGIPFDSSGPDSSGCGSSVVAA